MNTTTLIAIILIAIGIVAFGYQGISYTTSKNIVDIGPVQVSTDKTSTIPLPPIVGGIALAGGLLLLVTARKRS